MKLKAGFLKRNKIDKPLSKLSERKKTQINKIRDKRESLKLMTMKY